MNDRSFTLQPFPAAGLPTGFGITGRIARRARALAIHYDLEGQLPEVVIPPVAASPARRNGLWEETCFELFLAAGNSSGYWEINLSPAGHWNVYRFSDYRQGMQEEAAFQALPFNVLHGSELLRLSLDLDVNRIVPADQGLAVAVSAVIKDRDGAATHWALTHHGPQPDFHRRDGFILEFT